MSNKKFLDSVLEKETQRLDRNSKHRSENNVTNCQFAFSKHTCWLKPCFSSMTNVLYRLQGSPVTALKRVASIRNTSDWVISYSRPKPKRAVTVPAVAHRKGIPPKSRMSWKTRNLYCLRFPAPTDTVQ